MSFYSNDLLNISETVITLKVFFYSALCLNAKSLTFHNTHCKIHQNQEKKAKNPGYRPLY